MKNRSERIRYKLKKVSKRNRLSVYKSNCHIYAQIINDKDGLTIASSSSLESTIRDKELNKKDIAELVGKEIAKKSILKGVKDVFFDRGNYKYHGLIKILAEAARSEGLNF